MEKDDRDRLQAMVQDYYDGMVDGRADLLRQVFDPAARFNGVRDGEIIERGLEDFIGMTCDAPSPPTGEDDRLLRIEAMDVAGEMGVVKVVDLYRGRMYTDYLTVRRSSDGWKIVHKGFQAWRSAEGA